MAEPPATEALVDASGVLTFRGRTMRAALGRGGIRAEKREGDGATPPGVLPIRRILYRADRGSIPAASVPVEPLGPDDGWCDDPTHTDYNRRIRLPHDGRHETLWRDDGLYDLIGVLGWNDSPVVRGRGSAIFLHVARPDFAPTEGCVGLEAADLRALLAAGLTQLRIMPA